ncbi:ring finger protein [Anaeramoeba ignava]|uniref:Ring finger protein n=1 Tax=Anaeramoeba ignava TaxID=1746090 RepID=A0A9Q0RIB1_ANAIG|nr:ring finger protein [Anaeramoeba ignava]
MRRRQTNKRYTQNKVNSYNNYNKNAEIEEKSNALNIPLEIITKFHEIISKEGEIDSKSQIQMGSNELIKLIKELQSQKPSIYYINEKSQYEGTAYKKHTEFRCTFDILVLQVPENGWISIELLDQSAAVVSSKITFLQNEGLKSEKDDTNTNEQNSSEKDLQANIAINGHNHCLITNLEGRYKVDVKFLVPYISDKGCSLNVVVPVCVENSLRFIVRGKEEVQINCQQVLTQSQTWKVDDESNRTQILDNKETQNNSVHELKGAGVTIMEAVFKPSSYEIDEKIEFEIVEKNKIVNAQQEIIHSIGEGTIITTAMYTFQIIHGTMSQFDILIPSIEGESKFKILSVNGENINDWEVVDLEEDENEKDGFIDNQDEDDANNLEIDFDSNKNNENLDSNKNNENLDSNKNNENLDSYKNNDNLDSNNDNNILYNILKPSKKLRIFLKFGIEGFYNLTIVTELDTKNQSCKSALPVFKTLGKINRESGFIAIEARTNVEINEVAFKNMTKLSVDELPTTIVTQSQGSILYGYQFTKPNYGAIIELKKHDDATVLIAVIEEAHLKINYILAGRTARDPQ